MILDSPRTGGLAGGVLADGENADAGVSRHPGCYPTRTEDSHARSPLALPSALPVCLRAMGTGSKQPAGDTGGTRLPELNLFALLGAVVVRFRYLVVVAWLVVTIACVHFLPSLSSVSNNNNSSFLPKQMPSLHAAVLASPFERGTLPSALIVASRAGRPLTGADQAAIDRVEAAARRAPGVVVVGDQGVSGDGEARKAIVALGSQVFGESHARAVVDGIRATFARAGAPSGLSFYLTGEVASSVDNANSSNRTLRNTQVYSVIFILALLLLVYRAILAPIVTLFPAGLVLGLSGPVVAEASKAGVQVSPITQIMLSVLVLSAGTDYGIFLVFRVREEMKRGLEPHAAIIRSIARVGETITFSAGTVIAALLCLLLAVFGFYHGLGPALAIGVAIMLLAGLTLLPAILAILGRKAFWPSNVRAGAFRTGVWGQVAGRIVRHPLPTLLIGLILFGGLAVAVTRYAPSGFTDNGSTSTTSQSAQGTAVLAAHFPAAQANPTNILLRYPFSVWLRPATLVRADRMLRAQPVFRAISGPLDPNGTPLAPAQLQHLRATLGPAAALPPVPAAGLTISPRLYNAYRATAQFVSPNGRTVQFYATMAAGPQDSTQALQSIPAARNAVNRVAVATGAGDTGVGGQAAVSYDISSASATDLQHVVPVVLIAIAILLAVVLRSLVAPLYLMVSVGLSYLAALGLAVVVFMGIGHGPGLNFILPFFMFIFLMALGSDYNILVMTRIREEAHDGPLAAAVIRAVAATGGTVTSAGLILAGTFGVLTIAASGQIQQIGFAIAAGILMDTFLVRTLLVPSTVVLVGRWNWWPSHLAASGEESGPTRSIAESAS